MDRQPMDGGEYNRDLDAVTRGASRPQKLAIQIRGLARISSNSEFDSFYSRDDLSTCKLNQEARNAESHIKTDAVLARPRVNVVDLNQDYVEEGADGVQAAAQATKPKKRVAFAPRSRPQADPRLYYSFGQKRSSSSTPHAYEDVIPFGVEKPPYRLPPAALAEPPVSSCLTNIHFSGLHSRRPARSPEVQLSSATRMNVVIQSIDEQERRHSEVSEKVKALQAKKEKETFNQIARKNELKKLSYIMNEGMKAQGRAPDDILMQLAKARSYSPVKRGNIIQSPVRSPTAGGIQLSGRRGQGRWNVSEELRYQLRHEKTSKKLEQTDFNYVFFEANQRDKLMPKIDRINKERADKHIQRKLRQGFADLTSTFVMTQLSKNIDKDGEFSQMETKSLGHNKLTWSKMFMKQHKVQRLLVEYFEKINDCIANEFNHNATQLRDFMRYPRTLRQYRGKKPVEVPEDSRLATRELLSLSSGELSGLEDREGTLQSIANKALTRTDSKEGTLTQTLKPTSTVRKPVLQSKRSWTSASEDLPRFINELPDALKAKNADMIERVLKLFKTNKEFSEAFKKIVSNNKMMFTEKLERLGVLNEEYEQRECDEKHRNDIRESLARIEDQLVDIENDRKDMEIHFTNLEDQSQRRKIDGKRPGEKLLDRLGAWFAELESYQQDPIDQRLFASKLWRVAEDFEEELRQEERGHHILMKRMKIQFEEREMQLKQKFSFRVEALETALNELKTTSRRELDRAQMEINEMQSFHTNLALGGKFKETDDFLRRELEQYAEKGILEETEQEKIKKLLLKNIRAGMQAKGNQSELFKRRTENRPLNEFLLGKLRHYAKMMEMQKLREYTLADHIKQYQVKGAQIAEQHDEMHHKCVLYQDLFHGMLTLLSDSLVKLKCLSSSQKDELLETCKLDEARLTLDASQIEKVRQHLIGLEIDDNLCDFTDKLGDAQKQIGLLKQLMSKSTLIEWTKHVQKEPTLPRDEEVLSSCDEAEADKNNADLKLKVTKLFATLKTLVKNFDFEVQEVGKKESAEVKEKTVAEVTEEFVKELGKEQRVQTQETVLRKLDKMLPANYSGQKDSKRKNESQPNTKREKKAAGKKEAPNKEKKSGGKPVPPTGKSKNPAQDQKQIQEPSKQQIKNVPQLHDHRRRHALRLGVFDETVEYLVKSLSKKKIHYQMDQLTQKEVARHILYNFHAQLKIDPICSLILRATEKKKEGALSSSGTLNSLSCSVSELEVEEQIASVDDVIKKINESIQQLYQQIQLKQQSQGQSAPNLARQKILPIDCIRIEAFEAPQFNVMPFKLLLLKQETNEALSLFTQTLKIISNFFNVSHLEIDHESIRRLDIRRRIVKTSAAQCNLDSGDDGSGKYAQMQVGLIDTLDQLIIQLDKDKKSDKAFIDQEIDDRIFKLMKASLILSNSEKEFLTDVSAKVLLKLEKAKTEGDKAHAESVEKLQEQLESAQKELDIQKMECQKLENQLRVSEFQAKRVQSGKRKGSAKRGSTKSMSKTQTAKLLKKRTSIKLDQLNRNDDGTLDMERESESINIKVPTTRKNTEVADKTNQGSPNGQDDDNTLKLYRAPELIARGYQQFTNSVLQDMDQYAKKENINRQIKKQQEELVSQRSKNRSGVEDVIFSSQINKKHKKQESIIFMTQHLKQTKSESTISLVGASGKREYSPERPYSPEQRRSSFLNVHFNGQLNMKTQEDQCIETDISMSDLQLMLEYKERSTNKIISLEDEIRQLKKQSNRERRDFMVEKKAMKQSTSQSTSLDTSKRVRSSFDYYKSIQTNQLRREVQKPAYHINQHQSNVQKLLSVMESSFADPLASPYVSNQVIEIPVEEQDNLQYLVSHLPKMILIGTRNLQYRKLLKGSTLYMDMINTDNSSFDAISLQKRPHSALQQIIRSRQGSIQFNHASQKITQMDNSLRNQASKFLMQPGRSNAYDRLQKQHLSQQFLSNDSSRQHKPIGEFNNNQLVLSPDLTPQDSSFHNEQEFNINERASILKTRHRIRRKQQNQIQQKIGNRKGNRNMLPSQFKSYTGSRAQSQLRVEDSSQQLDNVMPSVAFNAESKHNPNQSQVVRDDQAPDENQAQMSNQQPSYNIIESIDDELINIGSLNEGDKKAGNVVSASNDYDKMLSQNANDSNALQSIRESKINDTFLHSQDRTLEQKRRLNKVILSNRSQRNLVKSSYQEADSFIIPFNNGDLQQQEGSKRPPKKSTTRSIQEEVEPISRMTPVNQYTDVNGDGDQGIHAQEQPERRDLQNQSFAVHEMANKDEGYFETQIQAHQNQLRVQHRQPQLNRINERPKTSKHQQRKRYREETSLIAQNIKNNIMEDFQNVENKALEKYRRSFNKVQRIESSKNPQTSAMMLVRHRSGKESGTSGSRHMGQIHANQSSVSHFDIDTQHHQQREESERGHIHRQQQAYIKFQQKASVTPAISQGTLLRSNKNSRIMHKRRTETAQSIDQSKLQKMMEFKNSMHHIRYKSSQRNTSANASSTKSMFQNRTSLQNHRITSTRHVSMIKI